MSLCDAVVTTVAPTGWTWFCRDCREKGKRYGRKQDAKAAVTRHRWLQHVGAGRNI